MNAYELVKIINAHEELAAQVEDGRVVVSKIDDRPIGNELIGDYIARILGDDIMAHLEGVNYDDAASVVTYAVR